MNALTRLFGGPAVRCSPTPRVARDAAHVTCDVLLGFEEKTPCGFEWRKFSCSFHSAWHMSLLHVTLLVARVDSSWFGKTMLMSTSCKWHDALNSHWRSQDFGYPHPTRGVARLQRARRHDSCDCLCRSHFPRAKCAKDTSCKSSLGPSPRDDRSFDTWHDSWNETCQCLLTLKMFFNAQSSRIKRNFYFLSTSDSPVTLSTLSCLKISGDFWVLGGVILWFREVSETSLSTPLKASFEETWTLDGENMSKKSIAS